MDPGSLTPSLRETLAVFERSEEPRTTPEVAEQLDLGRRSTYARLERLVDHDRLETKKVGANARVWWRSDDDGEGEEFRRLVEAVDEYAIFTLDADGHVRSWNPGAERIKGYAAEEILGEHFSAFYTDEDREAGVPADNLARTADEGVVEDEGWRVRADGSRFWANVTITAIRDADGDLDGFAKVTRDMTERREQERRLQRERDLVERILETNPVGTMVVDPDGEITRINDRAREILEIDDDEASGYDPGDRPVYDVDGEPVSVADHPASRVLSTGEAVYDWQARVEVPGGGSRWLSVNAAPVRDEDGDIKRVVTTGEDITQLKAQADQLERQRDELRAELDDVFTRIDDGFVALDESLRFVYVNERAASLLGREVSELTGEYVWNAFDPAQFDTDAFETARSTGETTSFEQYYEPLDTWFDVRVYPSDSGLSIYVRDVTERKARERELERYETIVETVQEGIYAVDQDGAFTLVNEPYEAMAGHGREELLGADVSTVIDDEAVLERAAELESELAAGERETGSIRAELTDADGDSLIGEATFSLMETDDGYERVGVVRDVTERIERERELKRYETIVETVSDGIYVLDDEFRFTSVNDAYVEMTGYDRDELLGAPSSLVVSEDVTDDSFERVAALAESGGGSAVLEADIERADGTTLRAESRFSPLERADGAVWKVGVVRDVSERVERERRLRRQVDQQSAVADLGQRAVDAADLSSVLADAADRVVETLGIDRCVVLEHDEESDALGVSRWAGEPAEAAAEAARDVDERGPATRAFETGDPIVVEDVAGDDRFAAWAADRDAERVVATPVGPADDPWGVLVAADASEGSVADHDVAFVQSVATILASAIDRHEREQALVHQREQLASMNDLYAVLREITVDVIEQSTRAEIEETVCAHLADATSYRLAWIGEADATSRTVSVRTADGETDYLEDVTISIDPADERADGPTGRAFRTGELRTSTDLATEDRFEPWREAIDGHDVRSSAAVPIVDEGTIYGVLNVYADRPRAFEGRVGDLLAQLGSIVGHAIAAAERKRALMSDELVELEFEIRDIFETFEAEAEAAGRIEIDHAMPMDEDFLVFGSTTPEAVDALETLADSLPFWESLAITGETEPTFEARLSEPPILSTVASFGGRAERTVIEDGDCLVRVQLAPSVDVRRVVETLEASYPDVDLRRRRQVTREPEVEMPSTHVLSSLSDQQRRTLETAHHAGYFDWPRERSGEDVAASLDIAPATFHQHLRKAQRKVFDAVFDAARV
ncbi:PAS domain S-box protein [Halovivax limisalsi]|uniref:PAS domain S-box protein n=1 Tax=Halovivax limisalsi TaxID=1453760 RepID=UPI001FFC7E46|nr:PAS domain S-box protein [Halovivax limisalsi]